MGTYLAKPVLDKHEDVGEELECPDTPLSWACVDMQGWRKSMEDAHVALTGVGAPPLIQYWHRSVSNSMHQALQTSQQCEEKTEETKQEVTSRKVSSSAKVFAVFDGHGGPEVARFCERHLVDVMIKQAKWEIGDIGGALVDTFHQLDRMIDHPARQEELTQLKMERTSLTNSQTQENNDAPDTALKPLTTDTPNKPLTPQRRGQKDRIPTPEKKAKSEDKSISDCVHKSLQNEDEDMVTSQVNNDESNDPVVTNEASSENTTDSFDVDEEVDEVAKGIFPVESTDTGERPSPNLQNNNDMSPDKVPSSDSEIGLSETEESSEAVEEGASAALVLDETDDEKISGGDARILIQKLLEISRANMEMNAENSISDIDGISNGHDAVVDSSKTSSMTPTYTPSRMMNGRKVCNLPDHPIHAGCTSVVAVITGHTLTVANAGDSRAVICRKGGVAEALSLDHKPMQAREMNRITKAGGFVNQFGRVNGNLNLSRSIGDLKYKQTADISPEAQMITAEPDITQVTLHQGDEFLIIGCDGIWDCLTNDQAVKYVRDRINSSTPKDIGVQMLDEIVSKNPKESQGIGGDNMTVLIVDLLPKSRSYFGEQKDKACENEVGMD